MTALRVLANLCSMVPGRVGGSEAYATRLLAAVATVSPQPGRAVEVELAAMAGARSAHGALSAAVWHEARWTGNNRVRRMAVESTWLARCSAGFDVVHHFGGRLPARRSGAAVLTVHDTQPLDLPGNFSATKRLYLGWALPRSARAAAVVAVPSQWVAERVADRLGVPADRILVVPSTYAGPAPPARPHGDPGNGTRAHPPAESEPWSGRPFVLYPAATYPHKNHATLIAAHAAVWARHGDTMLVLTGGAGRAHAAVAELVARTPGVVHLGRVDATRLASLMAAAAAVAFPSRYEGFGLPALEAMAAGTPVIAAAATALPEVVGDAGTLVDPDDLDGWVDTLIEVRSGSPGIRRRVQRGRDRAADFSPDRVARRLLDAWWHAVEGRP